MTLVALRDSREVVEKPVLDHEEAGVAEDSGFAAFFDDF